MTGCGLSDTNALMKTFGTFLLMPSLWVLCGQQIRTSAENAPLCPPKSTEAWSVETHQSLMSSAAFANVFQYLKALQSFSFTHEKERCNQIKTGPKRSKEGWAPQDVVNVLYEYAQGTLYTLTFEHDCGLGAG